MTAFLREGIEISKLGSSSEDQFKASSQTDEEDTVLNFDADARPYRTMLRREA